MDILAYHWRNCHYCDRCVSWGSRRRKSKLGKEKHFLVPIHVLSEYYLRIHN